MTPEQFTEFLKSNEQATSVAIDKYVNGKINMIDAKISNHVQEEIDFQQRLMPVIEAYETSQRALHDAQTGGKFVLWLSGSITAIGSAYLIIKHVFHP